MSLKSGYGKSTALNTSIENSLNEQFLNKIVQILELVLQANESISQEDQENISSIESFSSNNIPSISLKDYLFRIQQYTEAEESTFIIALIYIDRLHNFGIVLNRYNIHRMFFVATLLAIKYNEDNHFDIDYYSAIAGISTKELKFLEIEFTNLIKFQLFVNEEDYLKYKSSLDEIDLDDIDEDEDEEDIKK